MVPWQAVFLAASLLVTTPPSNLTRLSSKSVGNICIKMLGLASGIEKFVWGESGPQEVDKQDYNNDKSVSSSFVAGTQIFFTFIYHC